MPTLTIQDLSAAKELDRKAMSAVRGGVNDQALRVSQTREQAMGDPVPSPSPNIVITLAALLLL